MRCTICVKLLGNAWWFVPFCRGVCVLMYVFGVSVCTRPAACELGARGSLLDAHLAHDVFTFMLHKLYLHLVCSCTATPMYRCRAGTWSPIDIERKNEIPGDVVSMRYAPLGLG